MNCLQCRERGCTYKSRLQVAVEWSVNGDKHLEEMKTIAEIPIMVKVIFHLSNFLTRKKRETKWRSSSDSPKLRNMTSKLTIFQSKYLLFSPVNQARNSVFLNPVTLHASILNFSLPTNTPRHPFVSSFNL